MPTVGGLLVGLAHRYLSPAGRPLGPPDVIRAVQFNAALPDARSGLVSTATAALSLGAGASVGQYGPMVYLGALIGGAARRLRLGVPNLPAIAVSCGVAAAIATAFNAPIAGLVFAHEVVLRHYATQAFAPVTVASATGYVIANVVFDRPRCSWCPSTAWRTAMNSRCSRRLACWWRWRRWGSCGCCCAPARRWRG